MFVPIIVFPQLSGSLLVSKWVYSSLLIEIAFLFCLSLFQWKFVFSQLKHPLFLFYTAFIVWIVLSSTFGIDSLNSFWGNTARPGGWFLFVHMNLFFVFLLLLEKKLFEKSTDWFIGVATLVSLYAIFERLGIVPHLGGLFESRSSSTIGNPIYLAGFLIFPLTLALFQFLKNKKSWLYLCSGAMIFFGIITTWTRGAFVGIAVGIFVGGVIWLWNRFGWKMGISFLIVTSTIFVVFFSSMHFVDRNSIDRLGYWNIARQSFYEHPIMGIGYENYYRPAEKFYTPDLYAGEGTFIDKPHNQLLETLVTSGIIGVGLFVTLLFFTMRLLIELVHVKRIAITEFALLTGGLIAFHVQNLFAFDTITTMFAFVYFSAFLVHLERILVVRPSIFFRRPVFQWLGFVFSVLVLGVLSVFVFLPITRYFHILFLAKETRSPEATLAILPKISSLSFVYDQAEFGKFYKKRAGDVLSLNQTDTSNADLLLDASTNFYEQAIHLHPIRGEYWYQSASVSLLHANAHKQFMTETEKYQIQKSMDLMPARVEPKIIASHALFLEGKKEESIRMLEELDRQYYENPQFLWTLAVFYAQVGRRDDAAMIGYRAILKHVRINTASAILWIADYYAQKQDFEKVVLVYEKAVSVEPENISLLPNLLAAYISNNQREKAIEIAKRIQEKDPDHAAEAKDFINRLRTEVK